MQRDNNSPCVALQFCPIIIELSRQIEVPHIARMARSFPPFAQWPSSSDDKTRNAATGHGARKPKTHRLTFTAILHALMNNSSGGGSMRMRSALARMRLAFSSGRNSLMLNIKIRRGILND